MSIVRTTTELTTSLSNGIAKSLGIAAHEKIVEVIVRAVSPHLITNQINMATNMTI